MKEISPFLFQLLTASSEGNLSNEAYLVWHSYQNHLTMARIETNPPTQKPHTCMSIRANTYTRQSQSLTHQYQSTNTQTLTQKLERKCSRKMTTNNQWNEHSYQGILPGLDDEAMIPKSCISNTRLLLRCAIVSCFVFCLVFLEYWMREWREEGWPLSHGGREIWYEMSWVPCIVKGKST